MLGIEVIYYKTSRGENVITKFIDSLPKKSQSKVLRIFTLIEEYGLNSIIPHIKKITGSDLWEIRILGKDSVRIFYIMPTKNKVLILHCFKKQTRKTPIKEINTAILRFEDWILRSS